VISSRPKPERDLAQHFRTRVWLPAVKASGLNFNVRMHDLRHAHASWLLADAPTSRTSRNAWDTRRSRRLSDRLHVRPNLCAFADGGPLSDLEIEPADHGRVRLGDDHEAIWQRQFSAYQFVKVDPVPPATARSSRPRSPSGTMSIMRLAQLAGGGRLQVSDAVARAIGQRTRPIG
jgi:hypothetical protein